MIGWDGMPYEQEMRGALHAARQRAMALLPDEEADATVGRLLGRESPYSSEAGAMWAAVEWAATQMDVETWHKDRYIALRWWGPEYKAVSHYMTEYDPPRRRRRVVGRRRDLLAHADRLRRRASDDGRVPRRRLHRMGA